MPLVILHLIIIIMDKGDKSLGIKEFDITKYIPEELQATTDDLGITQLTASFDPDVIERDCELMTVCKGINAKFCFEKADDSEGKFILRIDMLSGSEKDLPMDDEIKENIEFILAVIKNTLDDRRMEY